MTSDDVCYGYTGFPSPPYDKEFDQEDDSVPFL
jgi:hypothetical protein